MDSLTYLHNTMQYKKICNAKSAQGHNVCQLTESEARAVAGGARKIRDQKIKRQQHNKMFLNYVLTEPTDGELRIFRGIAFRNRNQRNVATESLYRDINTTHISEKVL